MKLLEIARTCMIALKNTILGVNIISLFLIKNPKKMLRYIYEILFVYKALNSKNGLLQRNVYEVMEAEETEYIRLGNLQHNSPTWILSITSFTADLVNLCLICRIMKPKIVFEIGTLSGYTAFHLALNTPDDSKIFTLDLPKNRSVETKLKTTFVDDFHIRKHLKTEEHCFMNSVVSSKINCLFGDSATFDFSPFYGQVDFFFIDGAHSYEYVKSDTLNALKCTKSGSVIAWHDFGRVGVNGVSQLLLELSNEHDIFSVPGGSLAFMVVK